MHWTLRRVFHGLIDTPLIFFVLWPLGVVVQLLAVVLIALVIGGFFALVMMTKIGFAIGTVVVFAIYILGWVAIISGADRESLRVRAVCDAFGSRLQRWIGLPPPPPPCTAPPREDSEARPEA
jgi:hypothetical protein